MIWLLVWQIYKKRKREGGKYLFYNTVNKVWLFDNALTLYTATDQFFKKADSIVDVR